MPYLRRGFGRPFDPHPVVRKVKYLVEKILPHNHPAVNGGVVERGDLWGLFRDCRGFLQKPRNDRVLLLLHIFPLSFPAGEVSNVSVCYEVKNTPVPIGTGVLTFIVEFRVLFLHAIFGILAHLTPPVPNIPQSPSHRQYGPHPELHPESSLSAKRNTLMH